MEDVVKEVREAGLRYGHKIQTSVAEDFQKKQAADYEDIME